jgi:hypothetical protein
MASEKEDIEALIRETEALLPGATPEMRSMLEQQIENLRSAWAMLESVQPDIEALKQQRPVLSPELRAWFTPEPPVAVPAWVPDTITRAEVNEATLRCPPDAHVYAFDDNVGCSIPQGHGRMPISHGLTLLFWSTGMLKAQRFYETRLLRWDIEYHPTGGRSSVGFYTDVEPLVHIEHGLITSFAPNGTITAQTYFEHGVRHGWSKLWEDDGFPIGATRYERGNQVESIYADGSRR